MAGRGLIVLIDCIYNDMTALWNETCKYLDFQMGGKGSLSKADICLQRS